MGVAVFSALALLLAASAPAVPLAATVPNQAATTAARSPLLDEGFSRMYRNSILGQIAAKSVITTNDMDSAYTSWKPLCSYERARRCIEHPGECDHCIRLRECTAEEKVGCDFAKLEVCNLDCTVPWWYPYYYRHRVDGKPPKAGDDWDESMSGPL